MPRRVYGLVSGALERLMQKIVGTSTFWMEVYIVGQTSIWVVWLAFVDKRSTFSPFMSALHAVGGVSLWTIWAVLVAVSTFAWGNSRTYRVLQLAGLAIATTYWGYLAFALRGLMHVMLLPWLAIWAVAGCSVAFVYRWVTFK